MLKPWQRQTATDFYRIFLRPRNQRGRGECVYELVDVPEAEALATLKAYVAHMRPHNYSRTVVLTVSHPSARMLAGYGPTTILRTMRTLSMRKRSRSLAREKHKRSTDKNLVLQNATERFRAVSAANDGTPAAQALQDLAHADFLKAQLAATKYKLKQLRRKTNV